MCNLFRRLEAYDSAIILGAPALEELLYNEQSAFCEDTAKALCFADQVNRTAPVRRGGALG